MIIPYLSDPVLLAIIHVFIDCLFFITIIYSPSFRLPVSLTKNEAVAIGKLLHAGLNYKPCEYWIAKEPRNFPTAPSIFILWIWAKRLSPSASINGIIPKAFDGSLIPRSISFLWTNGRQRKSSSPQGNY